MADKKKAKATQKSDTELFMKGQAKIFMFVLAISAALVGIYIQVARNLSDKLNQQSTKVITNEYNTLIIADNLNAGYLDHVIDTLIKFGHKLSFQSSVIPATATDLKQYNLIWTHDYPFQVVKQLEPLQRINHFPGTGFITNKLTLSTTPKLPNVLRAFRLPAENDKFLAYSKDNPDILWVQKTDSHRGISFKTADAVDLNLNDSLVQEFMSNPLLIDGKKFDIGIYAVLTSVDPLRVYIYEAESLLRFCADPYLDEHTNTFNWSNIDSFVVGDDYTPIWLMPSLLRYYIGSNLSMKQTLNSYLRQMNKDGAMIWKQIETVIKNVYKLKEPHLARLARMYQNANNYNATSVKGSLNQFFEMVRFDFIIDENLKVYLMEANMSPNLSSKHFPPNRLLYEQVLASYFSLVGLTQFAQAHLINLPVNSDKDRRKQMLSSNDLFSKDKFGLDNIISEKELAVYEDLCVSDECHMNCSKKDCMVCYFCLNDSDKLNLRRAIFEQYSRWNFKRLLPSTDDEDLSMQLIHPQSNQQDIDSNHIHVQWFRGKCFSDKRFCSY